MEQKLECAIIDINPNITTNPIHDEKSKPIEKNSPKRKNGGGLRFLKVALHRMRGRRRSSKPNVVNVEQDDGDDDDASIKSNSNTWKKFVGSMRPLHLQSSNVQSPCSVLEPASTIQSPSPKTENGSYVSDLMAEEELYSPYSPSPASSRYASAVGLNELVQNDEDIEKRKVIIEEEHGDEMIDAKAEEFITRFYEQMRLQRMDSVDLRYYERNARSLG